MKNVSEVIAFARQHGGLRANGLWLKYQGGRTWTLHANCGYLASGIPFDPVGYQEVC